MVDSEEGIVEREVRQQFTTSNVAAGRLRGAQESVREELMQLALEVNPVNLSAETPDFVAPEFITKALSEAVTGPNILLNQYTRGYGHPRLVNALSKLYSKLLGHELDPFKEILVTVGAYGALHCAIMALINPGDEVIIIEPFFECYVHITKMAGGIPVFVPLLKNKTKDSISSADWVLDPKEVASKFTNKTKMIIINTPHYPLGKVFTCSELDMVAEFCKKHNVICVMDETYEWLVFKSSEHIRMATLPGMWELTITIGSAGKTFNLTGWKEAIGIGLEIEIERKETPDSYLQDRVERLELKRDCMAKCLSSVGMTPVIPEGGYFIVADFSKLGAKISLNLDEEQGAKDYQFAKWLYRNEKLQVFPFSIFYCVEHKHLGEDFVCFCFVKYEKAEQVFSELKKSLNRVDTYCKTAV
ncbi:kynurenine--oxoglutarate transaminase 3-like [Limulus polyphemus]|uniref:kynurenine--oxoglutarate transaminase n=1 Tax=Limulus polyphemus TaxID=6850 RepID=A0ABM1T9F5_LIMPO|nr:kynurenine--oxoglutarate transaminase 3-like [Limulus polyphemus]